MPSFHFPLPYEIVGRINGAIAIETAALPRQPVCVIPIDDNELAAERTAEMIVLLGDVAHNFETQTDAQIRSALRRAVAL